MAGRRAAGPLSNELRDERGIELASHHFCFFCSGIHLVYIFSVGLRDQVRDLGSAWQEMREEMFYVQIHMKHRGGEVWILDDD